MRLLVMANNPYKPKKNKKKFTIDIKNILSTKNKNQ